MSEEFPTAGDSSPATAVKIVACNETDWQQEYLAAVRERNSALSAAQAEIERLKAALAESREVIDIKNQKIDDLIEQQNVNYSGRARSALSGQTGESA